MFTVIRTFGAITRSTQNTANKRFKGLKLDSNMVTHLIRICEKQGMFLAELADLLYIERTTTFRAVQKLVELDYVYLAKDPINQKIKRVYPTQLALDIYPKLHAYEREQSQILLDKLTPEERIQMEKLVRKLQIPTAKT